MEATTLQHPDATLLIVDDDPLLTELFFKLMVKRGFRVLTASSGGEALEIVRADPVAVQLVMTDMTMPEMDGLALAAKLRCVRPELPVLLTTGHSTDMDVAVALPNVVGIVQKPYKISALASRIREILNLDQVKSQD